MVWTIKCKQKLRKSRINSLETDGILANPGNSRAERTSSREHGGMGERKGEPQIFFAGVCNQFRFANG